MAPDKAPPAFQDETKRLLGRCLLRLQQYERAIKALYASHALSGTPASLADAATKRASDVSGQTLGQLIGKLTGDFLLDTDEVAEDDAQHRHADEAFVRVKFSLVMSPEDLAQTAVGLRELVALRNRLVHHFIEDHDLLTEDGCKSAEADLHSAFNVIDRHCLQIREWLTHLDEARRLALEHLQSDAVIDYAQFGIRPDGSVDWEAAPIVKKLREAFDQLQIGGWATVDSAGCWIQARDQELTPERYLCRSWRHLIHDCQRFDLQYRESGGGRVASFRPRPMRKSH